MSGSWFPIVYVIGAYVLLVTVSKMFERKVK